MLSIMNRVQEFLQERGLTKRASYNNIRKIAKKLKDNRYIKASPEITKSYLDAYNKVNKYKPKKYTGNYGIGYLDHFYNSDPDKKPRLDKALGHMAGQAILHTIAPLTLLGSGHTPAIYSTITGALNNYKLNNFKSQLDPYLTMRLGSTVGRPMHRPAGLGAQALRDYKVGKLKELMNYLQGK